MVAMRRRLSRGVAWGAILSVASTGAILLAVPILDRIVAVAIAIAVAVSMSAGILWNLRARAVTCPQGHAFVATSAASRCPDCGQRGLRTRNAVHERRVS
jgi:hypothetical protein